MLCGKSRLEAALAALATETATALAATEATALTAEATATLATTEATTSGAIFLRTGFIDRDLATTEVNAIGLLSRHFGLFGRAHRDEGETARAARHTIKGDVYVGHGTELFKMSTELISRGLERQIADVEFGTLHLMIS